MSSIEMVRIGDYCKVVKGKIGIKKAVEGNYPLVTTAEERLSHNEYHFDKPSVIIPVVSSTGHGHASLKRIHYQEGEFSVGSILAVVTPDDQSVVNANFLYHYLDIYKEQLLVSQMKGMANVTLPIKAIENVKFPLISPKQQLEWVNLFTMTKKYTGSLSSEISLQQSLLDKLRQQILQDAISGKLTTKWREDNPYVESASELLTRIKSERERLMKEKKIRKQKELLPISNDEIPFKLPKGWSFCRLRELGEIRGGGTPSKHIQEYWNGSILWVSPKDMKTDRINETELKITEKAINESTANLIPENSLLIVGRSGILKRRVPIAINEKFCTVNQDMKVIVPYEKQIGSYIELILKGMEEYILHNLVKFGMTVHSLKYTEFENMVVPLPSISEIPEILHKVYNTERLIDQLETQSLKSQNEADFLMQAVLKEAFEG